VATLSSPPRLSDHRRTRRIGPTDLTGALRLTSVAGDNRVADLLASMAIDQGPQPGADGVGSSLDHGIVIARAAN